MDSSSPTERQTTPTMGFPLTVTANPSIQYLRLGGRGQKGIGKVLHYTGRSVGVLIRLESHIGHRKLLVTQHKSAASYHI